MSRSAVAVVSLLASLCACSSDDAGSGIDIGTGANGGRPNGGGGLVNPGTGGGGITINPGGASGGGNMPPPLLDTPVNVVITADNAYGFGYGSSTSLVNYFGGIENPNRDDIFACPVGNGPEAYTVPATDANAGNYLYIIGYADKSTTQGVLAKFFREGGAPVYTGMGSWQACATGRDFDPGSGGPDIALINEQIAACNAGNMDPQTTSGGWVNSIGGPLGRVAFGEDNSSERPLSNPQPGNEFLIACDIDPAAHWMWFEWESERDGGSPFLWPGGQGNPTKDFIIFRLGAEFVPPSPPK